MFIKIQIRLIQFMLYIYVSHIFMFCNVGPGRICPTYPIVILITCKKEIFLVNNLHSFRSFMTLWGTNTFQLLLRN